MALNADKIPVIDLGRGLTDCLARLGLGKLLDTLTIATTSRSSDRWGSVIPRPSQWRSCLSGCGCQIEDFSRKTTVGQLFAEYLPFPVEFCKKMTEHVKRRRWSLATFYFPRKIAGGHSLQPPAIKHDLYDDGEYAEMESWARCRNCGRKQFLVTWSRNLQTQWPSPQRQLGPGNKSEGVAAEERREVAATGSG